MKKICTCGRVGEHCPNSGCGSINKHPLVQRSAFMSDQIGADVRFYRCRKCGTEYGFLNGSLFDAECYAPKEIKLVATPQSLEEEVKDLNECIQFIQARGGVVEFPNGIKDINEESPDVVKPRVESTSDEITLISRPPDEDKQLFSLDDLFKRKDSTNE